MRCNFLLVGVLVVVAACASSGAHADSRCGLTAADSIYAGRMPVYRACGVDHEATLVSTSVHPDFRPEPGSRVGCFVADLEFVVDTTGRVEPGTTRVVRQNNGEFADAVAAIVSRLRYTPATLYGAPVRQITALTQRLSIVEVLVPAGSPPPRPTTRPPTC